MLTFLLYTIIYLTFVHLLNVKYKYYVNQCLYPPIGLLYRLQHRDPRLSFAALNHTGLTAIRHVEDTAT